MPHSTISSGMLLLGFGIVPSSLIGAAVFAQAVTTGNVDWVNMGYGAALVSAFGFLLTRLLPQMTKESNDTSKHMADKSAESLKYQADKNAEVLKHQADKSAESQKHLADVYAAENQSQRDQVNLWMDKVLELATREVCHKPIKED